MCNFDFWLVVVSLLRFPGDTNRADECPPHAALPKITDNAWRVVQQSWKACNNGVDRWHYFSFLYPVLRSRMYSHLYETIAFQISNKLKPKETILATQDSQLFLYRLAKTTDKSWHVLESRMSQNPILTTRNANIVNSQYQPSRVDTYIQGQCAIQYGFFRRGPTERKLAPHNSQTFWLAYILR